VKVLLATRNAGKLAELRRMLAGGPVEVVGPLVLAPPPPPPPKPPPPAPPSQVPGLATHSAPPVRALLTLSESTKIPPTSSSAMIATITA
jgi:hypothetical protein